MALKPQRRGAGEAQHHGLTARSREPLLDWLAHQLGTVAVGEDEPGRDGNDLAQEVRGHREIQAVAIGEIVLPLGIASVIEKAGLDLDDEDVAARRQGDHVGAPAVGQGKLGDHRMAARAEGPADAAL